MRPPGNAAYVGCLLLLCQGSKWLKGKSVGEKVLGSNPMQLNPRFLFCRFCSVDLFFTLRKKNYFMVVVAVLSPFRSSTVTGGHVCTTH